MGVTNYFTTRDTIRGQRDYAAGGIRSYARDALGSTAATLNAATAAVENRYQYSPYGRLVQKVGSGVDPAFQWLGTRGYRGQLTPSGAYVRNRMYSSRLGGWTTVDPLWPPRSAYVYAESNPSTFADPSGLDSKVILLEDLPEKGDDCVAWGIICWNALGLASSACYACAQPVPGEVETILKNFERYLHRSLGKPQVNALRHCIGLCIICRRCGCACAKVTGTFRETFKIVVEPWDTLCDLENNKFGRAAGCNGDFDKFSCLDMCKTLLAGNRLCLIEQKD